MPEFLTNLLPIFTKVLLTGGAGLAILGLGILLVVVLVKVLRVEADREHIVRLINTGNCQSKFYLWAETTEPELAFGFYFNQIPLAPVEDLIEEVVEASPEVVQAKSDKKKRGKNAAGKTGEVLKTGQAVAVKTGAAASLIGTVGSFLPGKAGEGLKSQADAARSIQAETAKATQAPKAAQRKMDSIQQSSGKLGVKTDLSIKQGGTAKVDKQEVFEAGPQMESADVVRKVKKVLRRSETGALIVQAVETGPGEKLEIALNIGKTKRRYPTGSFSYTVWSQQIPTDDRFGSGEPVAKNGLVSFKPIGAWRYMLPGLCSVLVMLLALFGLISVIPLIWG